VYLDNYFSLHLVYLLYLLVIGGESVSLTSVGVSQ